MCEIPAAAAAEVIEYGDATAVREQPLDEVAADETRSTGDEDRARYVGHGQMIRVSGTGTTKRPPAAMNAWWRFTIGSAKRQGRMTT